MDDFTATYDDKTKAVTSTIGDGSIMLKDFTATTFHVNNDIYKINSKNKFVKQ